MKGTSSHRSAGQLWASSHGAHIHRLDRSAYHQLAEGGAFEGRRVELIDGVIIAKNSAGAHRAVTPLSTQLLPRARRARAVVTLNETLVPQVSGKARLRPALPLALSSLSEPVPDFAIVSLDESDDYPSTASLVIEVADSTRAFDLGLKARLYAAAKLPEYWVVDLQTDKLVVHLEPRKGEYQRVRRFGKGREVTSSVAPKVTLKVATLF